MMQSTLPKMRAEADQLRMTDVNGGAVLAEALVEKDVIGEGKST